MNSEDDWNDDSISTIILTKTSGLLNKWESIIIFILLAISSSLIIFLR